MAIVLYSTAALGLLLICFSGLVIRDILLSIPLLLLLGYCGYWLFWLPTVMVTKDGTTIVNPVRTISVPWQALRSLETKYSMTLLTESGKYSAWAAPSPGPMSRKSAETEVVQAVRASWAAARKENNSAPPAGTETPVGAVVQSRVNWLQLGVALGLIAATAFCFLLVR